MEGSRGKEKNCTYFWIKSSRRMVDSISDSKGVVVKVIYDLNKIDFDSMSNIACGFYAK